VSLSIEEKELLLELLDSDGLPILLRVIESKVEDLEAKVLRFNLAEGVEALAYEKARAEGARKLLGSIRDLKQEVQKKQRKP